MSADSIDPARLDDLWDELWFMRADPAVVVNLLEVTDHPTRPLEHLFEVAPLVWRLWVTCRDARMAAHHPDPHPQTQENCGRWPSATPG